MIAWYWYLLAMSVCACFGYVLGAMLAIGRAAEGEERAREYYEARQREMCRECRELDMARNDAEREVR